MDPSSSGGRRKKRGSRDQRGGRTQNNRGQNNRGRRRNNNTNNRGGRHNYNRGINKLPPEASRDDSSILSGRNLDGKSSKSDVNELSGPPNGFGLFCAYYLGVTPDNRYQKPSLDETSKRYGISPEEVEDLLVEHRLDPDTLSNTSFDLEGAQLDVRLAPAGISRIEIARDQYSEYLASLDN